MNATGAASAAGSGGGGDMSGASSYVPGRPKRQTYRRANTDRIASATAAAAAASSYAPDPLFDSSLLGASAAAATAAEDPYVSCFGSGSSSGTGNYGTG